MHFAFCILHLKDLMQKEYSNSIEKSVERAVNLSYGITPRDLNKYTIGIIHAGTVGFEAETTQAIKYIEQGILHNECVPLVFSLYCPDDGIANMSGSPYNLPYRDILADSVQSLISIHALDGVVLVANFDNAISGLMMGAIRTSTPFIVSSIGIAHNIGNTNNDITQVLQGISRVKSGAINIEQLQSIERNAMGKSLHTRLHSMACIAEILGVTMNGNGTIPSNTNASSTFHIAIGHTICKAVQDSIQPKMLLTPKAFDNAIALACAISASIDSIIHLIAIAYECKIKLDLNTIQTISQKTPTLVAMHALGQSTVDLYRAGGISAVTNSLVSTDAIDGSTMCINQKKLSQNVLHSYVDDEKVIYPTDAPYLSAGSIAVLVGNIAEEGAFIRRTPQNYNKPFVGRCKVYDSAMAAKTAILMGGIISAGDALVVRYEGTKGGPGMRDLYELYALLCGAGLSDSVAIVTDGRLSFADGICVSCITPECFNEGELALARDGDKITIDISKSKLELDISSKEFKQRLKRYDYEPNNTNGWLERYSNNVQPATSGAVLMVNRNKR